MLVKSSKGFCFVFLFVLKTHWKLFGVENLVFILALLPYLLLGLYISLSDVHFISFKQNKRNWITVQSLFCQELIHKNRKCVCFFPCRIADAGRICYFEMADLVIVYSLLGSNFTEKLLCTNPFPLSMLDGHFCNLFSNFEVTIKAYCLLINQARNCWLTSWTLRWKAIFRVV